MVPRYGGSNHRLSCHSLVTSLVGLAAEGDKIFSLGVPKHYQKLSFTRLDWIVCWDYVLLGSLVL